MFGSKVSQHCAIGLSYFQVVNGITPLNVKICDVDVDDIAFGNFDSFPLMEIVGVVRREVWTCQMSTCWEALWFFRQNTYSRKMP